MKDKIKKIINIIFKVLKGAAIVFFLGFALIICLQRFSNNSIALFNYRIFSVATGSMAPKYNIGDVLLCKSVDTNTLEVGDDISYLGKEGSYKGKIITHSIIDIQTNSEGEKIFQTKGIASTSKDPKITSDQIYGKIIKRFSFLSWLYKFVTTRVGLYVCIILPIIAIVASEIVSTMIDKYKKRANELEKNAQSNEQPQNNTQNITQNSDEQLNALMNELNNLKQQYENQVQNQNNDGNTQTIQNQSPQKQNNNINENGQ